MYLIRYELRGQQYTTKAFSEETRDDLVRWMLSEGRTIISVEEK